MTWLQIKRILKMELTNTAIKCIIFLAVVKSRRIRMRIITLLYVLLVGFFPMSAQAQESIKCAACRPITVELQSAKAMLEFVAYSQQSDVQRKKVLDQLMDWVVESKDYETGIAMGFRFYSWSGDQKLSIDQLLGKEGIERFRTFLATSEKPGQLVKIIRIFREHAAYGATERELMCAKVARGNELELLEGFESGCRFGHFADLLRARALSSKDPAFAKRIVNSDFGKVLMTWEELRPFHSLARN
jgi:hypothetical protein